MKALWLALVLVGAQTAEAGLFNKADWTSKLDLSTKPKAAMARELHDGNWLAGLAWAPYKLQNIEGFDIHAGIMQAWRVDKGDAATCLTLGIGAAGLGSVLGAAVEAMPDLTDFFKPLRYGKFVLSLDCFGGARPQHGSDVHTWVYGGLAQLGYAFSNADLKQGL